MQPGSPVRRGTTTGKSYINITQILKKLAADKNVDKILQKAVYTKVVVKHQKVYDAHYKALVKQILAHLRSGFPGAASQTSITIMIPSIDRGPGVSFKAGGGKSWPALNEVYRKQKKGYSSRKKGGRAGARPGRGFYAGDTSNLFWTFKRNMAERLAAQGFSPMQVSVNAFEKTVKRGGVLARGRNGFTIGYNAGLQFSTLPTPLNEMVRTPFMKGKTVGPAALSKGAFGKGDDRGIHILALVEARRPFIMELSGTVGRMARQRLGMKL